MHILVKGKSAALSAKEVRFAVKFFAMMLMTKRMAESLSIEVTFVNDKHDKAHASMTWIDRNVRPKVYDVELNAKMGKRRLLIALAHEMVHIKQFAKGEMKDYVSEKKYRQFVKWRNEDFSSDMMYWERPWEIEAYGRELGLYEMYKTEIREKKIKF